MTNKERIWEIDFLRGLAILCMVFDHSMYDLGFVFGPAWFPLGGSGVLAWLCTLAQKYWYFPPRETLQIIFVVLFIVLSGTSSSFSKSNIRRGLRLLAVALLLSAFTWGAQWVVDHYFYAGSEMFISFGILHLLAVSILFAEGISHLGKWPMLLFGLAMTAGGVYLFFHHIDVQTNLFAPIGIYNSTFSSADYFPLLPWAGVFLLGTLLGRTLYAKRKSLLPAQTTRQWHRPFRWVGGHSLWVYLLHQPVLWLFFALVGYICGFGFQF